MKPMLADDWIESKVVFPVIVQPKIDGVRALNMLGKLTGRSLKSFKNKHVTAQFSHSKFLGFDGEMAANDSKHPDLCRLTTSALGTIEGAPWVHWWLFDYVTHETKDLPYAQRLERLHHEVALLWASDQDCANHLRVVPSMICFTMSQLKEAIERFESSGFEGTILRDPHGPHKQGRSGAKPLLWRIKSFMDAEAVVMGVTEGEKNLNEAKVNELGLTERSTHQANMIPNGMIGTLLCRLIADVVVDGTTVFQAGDEITVSAGKLTALEREMYFNDQTRILGKTIKFQFFPKGMKDKLRFPTFQSFRDDADMSN